MVLYNRLCNSQLNWQGQATHKSRNFGGDTPKKGTTPKLKSSKSTDFDKQIVYRGEIYSAESKSVLFLELGPLYHCDSGRFRQILEKNFKILVGQIISQIRPFTLVSIIFSIIVNDFWAITTCNKFFAIHCGQEA